MAFATINDHGHALKKASSFNVVSPDDPEIPRPWAAFYHQHLESCRIPHEYGEFPGAHNWEYWDLHVREALAFHARSLKIERKSFP